MTLARELADFLVQMSFNDLPPLPVERAEMAIASTIASAAAGSTISSAAIVRSIAKATGGTADASIWFDAGSKLPVANVARVNAMMSDAAASDDSDLRNIAHIGTIVSTTSIAMAQSTDASGQDVLSAIVLGYEAAGKLLRLSRAQMAQAIAIAATSIGGLGTAADRGVRVHEG